MTAVDRVVIDTAPGVSRVLFLAAGKVVEIWVEGEDMPSLVGGIALVIARRAGGAPVADLPVGSGYFRDVRPNDGARVIAEVVRDGIGVKRAVLRGRIELAGDGVVLTPFADEVGVASSITGKARRASLRDAARGKLPDGVGAMVRSAAADAPAEGIAEEVSRLAGLWRNLREEAERGAAPAWLMPPPALRERAAAHAPGAALEIETDGARFREAGGEAALDLALARDVAVADGVTLVVDEGEAATLIDINIARSPKGEALVRANSEAMAAVAELARLRGLRGTLLVDPPRMRGRDDRAKVAAALERAVEDDPAAWQILGWTPGGMLECLRESPRRPLSADLLVPVGERRLSARARAWAALERLRREVGGIARPRLRVPPAVAGWLDGPGAAIVAAERWRLGALTVVADPVLGEDDMMIDGEG